MLHAPLTLGASRHAVRVHATATAAPADLKSTTVALPRLQFAPRGRMTREVDGVALTGTGVCCWPLPGGVVSTPPDTLWVPAFGALCSSLPGENQGGVRRGRGSRCQLPRLRRCVRTAQVFSAGQPPKQKKDVGEGLSLTPHPSRPNSTHHAGADQIVRYDPGHPSPMKPVGGLDGLAALQLGSLSVAAETINCRAAMVGVLGVVLDDRSLGQQVFSGSLISAALVIAFVTAASLAPFVAGISDADELFPNELDAYANQRLPDFWTPTAERLNGRIAAAAFALIVLQELF
jgi:hypothetical protein